MRKHLVTILVIMTLVNFYLYYPISDRSTNDSESFSLEVIDPTVDQIEQFTFSFKKYYTKQKFHGRLFDKKWNTFLVDLDLFNITDVDDETILRSLPVIVTAFDSSHFENGKKFLDSFSKFYNSNLVYVYDIGLRDNETEELTKRYSNIIVEIRPFLFAKYPAYVSNLHEYRWKPLIIASMLKEFPCIWWIDSSVRLKKSLTPIEEMFKNLCSSTTEFLKRGCHKFPWIFVGSTNRTVSSNPSSNVYDYLPTPDDFSANETMYGAQLQLIFSTNEIRRNILRYFVLCALEKDCMTPTKTNLFCHFLFDRHDYIDVCQRYDHFVINILISWSVKFNRQIVMKINDE